MATPRHEQLAKTLMQHAQIPSGQRGHKRSDRAHHSTYPQRANRLLRPVTRTEEELQQREQGWNDRFFYEKPSKPAKLGRSDRNAAITGSPNSLKQKDKKILDERAHYGGNHRRRLVQDKKPTNNGRLIPLGVTSGDAATNAGTPTSKEEKLRFKVLKAIDTRETLLYQLNALILCTPVQETLFHPSRPAELFKTGRPGVQSFKPKSGMALAPNSSIGNNSMTSAREATKMAQQIAMDIQIAGMQCVEALVEWMLEAGATADKPPPFLWRGRNYFVKMYGDLDFAGQELQARGVILDCYTLHNPLLIRPDQKLGRVLAAQSIVTEMVEAAGGLNMMPVLVHYDATHPRPPKEVSARVAIFRNGAEPTRENGHNCDDGDNPHMSPIAFESENPDNQQLESADIMILRTEDDMESARSTINDSDEVGHNEDSVSNSPNMRAGHELIDILDESLSGFMVPNHASSSTVQRDANFSGEYGRNEILSTTYDGDFDAEVRDNNETKLIAQSKTMKNEEKPSFITENVMESTENMSLSLERSGSHFSPDYEGEFQVDMQKHDFDVARVESLETTNALPQDEVSIERQYSERSEYEDGFEEEPPENNIQDIKVDSNISSDERKEENPTILVKPAGSNDNNQSDTVSLNATEQVDEVQNTPANLTLLLHETLKEFCESSISPLMFDAVECKNWCDTHRPLREALDGNVSIRASLANSFYSIIDHYQLMTSPTAAVSFMKSDSVIKLELVSRLWAECMCVVDEIFGYLTEHIENNIEQGNSLLSEVEMNDLVDCAESVFQRFEEATRISSQVFQIMKLIFKEKEDVSELPLQPRQSQGFSRVLKIFYPYLVNQAPDKLCAHLKRVVNIFTSVHVNIFDLSFLMDPTCKALMLNAHSSSLNCGDSVSETSDEDVDTCKSFPKITVVCDRHDALSTSLEFVWSKCLSSHSKQRFAIFPFFLSAYGEKVVEGKRVEEGEGKGPLKEWFVLVSRALASKWQVVTDDSSTKHNEEQEVVVNGNKLTTPIASYLMQPGFRVEWTSTGNGESISRVVNKRLNDDCVLLDRGVPDETFPSSLLRILRPQHAYLEYKQDTECFWLNEQTEDSPQNRRVLCFMGWFMANTIAHFTYVDVQVYRLLFHLVLNDIYSVSLDDALQIDPTWHKALLQTKALQTSEWIGFLEMEGLSETMTHEDYIDHALAEKFGSKSNIPWQIHEFRSGFECVVSLDSLRAAGIDADDLVTIVCGPGQRLDSNFRVDHVFRVSSDPDFVSSGPLYWAFWAIVNSFDATKKRKFVKFVTGVETLPLPGTEFLRIEMPFVAITAEDNRRLLQMLPQSHTCDNTLELPHYWRALCWRDQQNENTENAALEQELAVLLRSKLEFAIDEASSGYGLDATHDVAGVLPDERSGSSAEESYESLDLPALSAEEEASSAMKHDVVPRDEHEPQDLTSAMDDPTTLQEVPIPSVPTALISNDEDYEESYDDWEEDEKSVEEKEAAPSLLLA